MSGHRRPCGGLAVRARRGPVVQPVSTSNAKVAGKRRLRLPQRIVTVGSKSDRENRRGSRIMDAKRMDGASRAIRKLMLVSELSTIHKVTPDARDRPHSFLIAALSKNGLEVIHHYEVGKVSAESTRRPKSSCASLCRQDRRSSHG